MKYNVHFQIESDKKLKDAWRQINSTLLLLDDQTCNLTVSNDANQYRASACQYCGQLFLKQNNRQIYCSEHCAKSARLEYKAVWNQQYRRKYPQKEKLGTGLIGAHSTRDFEKEQKVLKREKRRLRISPNNETDTFK